MINQKMNNGKVEQTVVCVDSQGNNAFRGQLATETTLATLAKDSTLSTLAAQSLAANVLLTSGNSKVDATTAAVQAMSAKFLTASAGQAIFKLNAGSENEWRQAAVAGGLINTSDLVIKSATAGARNYITDICLQNVHASIATEFILKDGQTIIARFYLSAGTNPNSSLFLVFQTPLKSSVNTDLNVACVTTGAKVYVNTGGYTAT